MPSSARLKKEKEIERVQDLMYNKCYIGHIQQEKWKQFAAFCVEYAAKKVRQARKEWFKNLSREAEERL